LFSWFCFLKELYACIISIFRLYSSWCITIEGIFLIGNVKPSLINSSILVGQKLLFVNIQRACFKKLRWKGMSEFGCALHWSTLSQNFVFSSHFQRRNNCTLQEFRRKSVGVVCWGTLANKSQNSECSHIKNATAANCHFHLGSWCISQLKYSRNSDSRLSK